MAPECMAGRQLLLVLLVFVLFLLTCKQSRLSTGLRTPSTLDIRSFMENTVNFNLSGQKDSPAPLHLQGLPAYLCRTSGPRRRRKRSRHRGKRGGLLVKVKSRLALFPSADHHWILAGLKVDCCRFVSRRSLDPVLTWLVLVVGSVDEPQVLRYRPPRLRRGGVDASLL